MHDIESITTDLTQITGIIEREGDLTFCATPDGGTTHVPTTLLFGRDLGGGRFEGDE